MSDHRGANRDVARGRRECLSCGALTEQDQCETCGSTDLAPLRQRLATSGEANTPPSRFARGPTRTGRPD